MKKYFTFRENIDDSIDSLYQEFLKNDIIAEKCKTIELFRKIKVSEKDIDKSIKAMIFTFIIMIL